MKELGYVLYGIYCLLTIGLLANGLVQLHLLYLSRKKTAGGEKKLPASLPFVSIQVPVYNEKYVVEELLQCLANLDYPRDKYEILVLDDSTDETVFLIDRKVAEIRSKKLSVSIVRRKARTGYKAGALQESLSRCTGDLVAVFDADFRPSPSFLKDMIPFFSEEKVGLVQARWGHSNQNQNILTRIQSFLLDTYFTIEQKGRHNGGYYTNFCGTAGIWRKACIEDAGGWDGDVLSEDLDLSYRAQLRGWRIVYANDILVPAELPATMDAFKLQQARWTKGIVQVFRKNGNAVATKASPVARKIHALFHLSSSLIFPCLLLSCLLTLPLLLFRQYHPAFILLTNLAAAGGVNLVFLTIVFHRGQAQGADKQFWKYYPVFLLVYMALSVQNSLSVLQALRGQSSPFLRTPKYASQQAAATTYFLKNQNRTWLLELFLFLYFLTAAVISIHLEDYFYLGLYLMMMSGLGILLFHSFGFRRCRLAFSFPGFSGRRSVPAVQRQ